MLFDRNNDTSLAQPLSLLGFALLVFGITACAGSNNGNGGCPPDWYESIPNDPNYVFSAQTATSRQMQTAVDKATTSGRAELASSLETEVQSMSKSFTEELSDDLREQYLKTVQTVTSQVLQGTSAAQRKICESDNGTTRAYVLMEMPIGKAADQLMSQLQRRNEKLYTRFRSNQAFEEMRKLVEEYEKERKRMRPQPQSEDGGGSDEGSGGKNR